MLYERQFKTAPVCVVYEQELFDNVYPVIQVLHWLFWFKLQVLQLDIAAPQDIQVLLALLRIKLLLHKLHIDWLVEL